MVYVEFRSNFKHIIAGASLTSKSNSVGNTVAADFMGKNLRTASGDECIYRKYTDGTLRKVDSF